MKKDETVETFYPKGREQWRNWLKKNHNKKQSIWLICYKKKTNIPSLVWSDAVDEALCFGWIDSQRKSVDEDKFIQYFCKRKATGTWSKINKEKIKRLTKEGLMAQAGLDAIEAAKKNGSWTMLDDVEELKIPADLSKALSKNPIAKKYVANLSRSHKRAILVWLVMAKREETRAKRIAEVVELAGQHKRPKHIL